MSSALKINKPTPIHPGDDLIKFDSNTDVRETLYAMREGQSVLITEFYSNGMLLLKELQKHLKIRLPNKTIKEQHAFRAEYHKLSNQILLQIKNQKLVVDKAPKIGWFAKLFANKNNFLLTFPEVQRLNSAWQKYNKGIKVPVLRNKVHPYLGTYFPTRFDHLTLFDNWLKRYEGPKKSAIDVGIGSGVLSFQMVQHGFQKVFGTDTNPNAIFGLKEFMGETKLSRKVELDYGNLFGKWEKETELIVFNPPWLPAISSEENIDEAVYYNKNLFSKFFAEANNRLSEDGKLVILFSNAAQIKKLTKENPIEKELAKGIRFKLEKCLKKTIKPAVDKTKRNKKEAALEEVQLWVLTKV
ncbi:methyltransferase [Polaribacter sp. 20A6]|uniref:methyltransferase n=1 Tax=Polaribacter sp. 20A6 TaxID=2687289 RepID=UPI0013FD146E|nr:methyltransferase [Polaribacter sp. 20A6]